MRSTAAVRLVALAALAALGCTGDRLSLVVDLKTDLVPNEEFVRVRSELFADVPTATATPLAADETPAATLSTDRLVSGARVGELADLAPGEPVLRVSLIARDGSVVLDRLARIHLQASRVVTLVLTRSCLGVTCPDGGSCVAGECTDASCTEEDPAGCPMAECAMDDECPAPSVSCATRRCVSGVCLALGDDARCASEQFCHPSRGCQDRTISAPDGGADAGPPPPPEDGGALDAGPGCVPRDCAAARAECGAPEDGCGGVLDCGGCTAPEVCGGGTDPYGCDVPPAVDTTPPTVSIAAGPPDPDGSTTASFTFTGADTGGSGLDRFECRLDTAMGGWSPCSSPRDYPGLGDGVHTFEVVAYDGAGNGSAAASWSWRVDTAPPRLVIGPITDPRPSSYTATAMVPFTFSCDDGLGSGCDAASRACQVDGTSTDVSCGATSGTITAGFTGRHRFGDHTLEIRVADAAGNVGTASAPFTLTRCAADLQYPNRTSTGFARGDCCSGLVDTSGWTDFSFGFFHPRGDGSCRPMSDWEARPWECIWGGASCPSGYRTTADWGGGCATAAGATTCVPSLADARVHCGSDGGSGSQTPYHGRAGEGWHPPASAGCAGGMMSTSELLARSCSTGVCWTTIDVANDRGSLRSTEACKSPLVQHCRSSPYDAAVACVCLPSGAPAPYADDMRN